MNSVFKATHKILPLLISAAGGGTKGSSSSSSKWEALALQSASTTVAQYSFILEGI